MSAEIMKFSPRRRPGPHPQSMRSKIDPPTAHQAFVHFFFSHAQEDARLTWRQKRLLMELSVLAADASGRRLGHSTAELAMMFEWRTDEVRIDAEACVRLKYLDLCDGVILLRDPRDRVRRVRKAA